MKNIFHITRADKSEKCARQPPQATIFVIRNAETFSMVLPTFEGFYTKQRNYFSYRAILFMTFSYEKKD